MRAFAIVVAHTLGCGGGAAHVAAPASAPQLPALELQLRDGRTWRSSEVLGKVVVLDVWATYCAPCKRAFPKLGKLAVAFPSADVIGISVDEDDAAVDRYLVTTPATFTIARDRERRVQSGALAVDALPTLIVVDKQGRVRLRAEPARESDYDQLPTIVARLAAE